LPQNIQKIISKRIPTELRIKRYLLFIAFMLLSLVLCGCETLHYYGQAIYGQCSILLNRKPISEIIADSEAPAFLRERLAFILAVRQFAASELQLPVKDNYLTYVELERPYVVWNVFAAPEFSLTPTTWCYPVVGCASYRGYFSEQNAHRYAAALNDRGYDVYVAGVTAYSTLGWFDDPVLSTFIQYSKAQSAGLIFHELAHQVLYVKDDTEFNESFATAVEQEGLRRWQQTAQGSQIYREYITGYHHREQFVQLILHYRQMLETLYRTDASPSVKRNKKASIFSQLRDEFKRMNTNGMGLSVYANWIDQDLNNAKIGSVAAYHDFVPAFLTMLAQSNGDLNQFYQACRQLGQKNKEERHRILSAYLDE
jgi:predicted aminopeptidase